MNKIRFAVAGAAAIGVACLLVPVTVSGQNYVTASVCPDDNHSAFHACATARLTAFTRAKTPAGHPDFSGLWRRRAAAHENLEAHPKTADDAGGASVVVDPADGRVPMQPWAQARAKETAQKLLHHNAACFLSGVPTTMYMTGLFQFTQTREHLLIQSEESHAVRIIPLAPRPHIGRDIRLWQGDSRGQWEGNTLVVDTTNQRAQVFLDQQGRFFTDEARVVERFTMLDAGTMHYQATIDDPNVYTRPFTIAVALRRNAAPNVELWEEACYEENTESMEHFRKIGYQTYAGITGAEARALRQAFEKQGGAR